MLNLLRRLCLLSALVVLTGGGVGCGGDDESRTKDARERAEERAQERFEQAPAKVTAEEEKRQISAERSAVLSAVKARLDQLKERAEFQSGRYSLLEGAFFFPHQKPDMTILVSTDISREQVTTLCNELRPLLNGISARVENVMARVYDVC